MSELTVGIEIELHSEAISSPGEFPRWYPEARPRRVEGSRIYFWCDGDREPLALPQLNRVAIASNPFTVVTLEVSQALGGEDILLHPSHSAKLELITPFDCTQSQDAFRASTRDLLFVIHHLYFFVAAPCTESNTTVLSHSGPEEKAEYRRDFAGFVLWYNEHLRACRVGPEVHPPLELASLTGLGDVPDGVCLRFAKNTDNAPIIPLLAPQLTFSGPLERIPALFSTEEGTFDPRRLAVLRSRRDNPRYTPHDLELAAVKLGYQLVEGLVPGTQKKLQKLWGFFALVAYHVLRHVLKGKIEKSDARGGHPKDEFRFLLKSDLQQLYLHGLSERDRLEVARSGQPQKLVATLWECCRQFVKETFDWEGGRPSTSALQESVVLNFLDAIFLERGNYPSAIKELVDEYALLSQTERDVPRKGGVHLQRPIMEYRRLIGKHHKHFATVNETALAIESLYNKLRFLELGDRARAERNVGPRAYYGYLEKLAPRNEAVVNGLGRLNLRLDSARPEIEKWWRNIDRSEHAG